MAWHAGNLAVNRRSIAICIDDNLTNHNPTGEALEAVGNIIRSHYQEVLGGQNAIVGPREVSSSPTICPGNTFLLDWKDDVIDRVSS